MGANQSQEEIVQSNRKEIELKRKSYLEDYPYPLGRFKSVYNIDNILSRVANRRLKKIVHARWYAKANIIFTHGILMPKELEDVLTLVVYCGVKESTAKHWRIKANVKFILHNLNDVQNSVEYDYGDVWFDNYTHEMPVIYQSTIINLDDLLDENLGFVKNNKMRMGTDIRVLEVEGFHQPTVVNYRVPPAYPFYQQICKFPDENLYINKAVMSIHCILEPHNVPIRNHGDQEFPQIPSTGALEEFWDCAYGFPIPLYSREGMFDLLTCAKFFKMRSVAQRAAQTIINETEDYAITKSEVSIAIDFDMRRVIHSWLNRKKSIKKKDLEDLNIEKMSGEITKVIVKRVLELGGWEKEN